MPIYLSAAVRRALGLGAVALVASIAIWIATSNNSIVKKKRKRLEIVEKKIAEVVEVCEVKSEVKVMEVLVSSTPEKLESAPHPELLGDVEEVPDEVTELEEKPASRSWTDLIEEELEEASNLEKALANQLPKSQPQTVPSDSRKGTSSDSGVVSPAENAEDQQLMQRPVETNTSLPVQPEKKKETEERYGGSRKNTGRQTSGGNKKSGKLVSNLPSCNSSDSGQGSETGDGLRFTYHFNVPSDLTGKLIGSQGSNIDLIRRTTHCEISVLRPHEYSAALSATYCNDLAKFTRPFIRKHLIQGPEPPRIYTETQVCVIEGSRNAIERCLEYLRDTFPLEYFPKFTMEQINRPKQATFNNEPESDVYEQHNHQQLMLAQNALHEVTVSAVVSAGHIFVHQSSHPSFSALCRLDTCMNNVYNKNQAPEISRNEIVAGLVCVAPCDNNWYRVQVVSFDAVNDCCDFKFLDYGSYSTIQAKELRKIRTDFLKLPFQAIECYMANVVPQNSTEWSLEAGIVLQELFMQENQVLSCRMLGVAEDYVPMVHLYSTDMEGNTKLLNRELVDNGGAAWIEHSGTEVPPLSA